MSLNGNRQNQRNRPFARTPEDLWPVRRRGSLRSDPRGRLRRRVSGSPGAARHHSSGGSRNTSLECTCRSIARMRRDAFRACDSIEATRVATACLPRWLARLSASVAASRVVMKSVGLESAIEQRLSVRLWSGPAWRLHALPARLYWMT